MPTNKAAWMTTPKAKPLEVKSAPYTSPRENEIVIKNGAVAINPIDWILQDMSSKMMFPQVKYPFVFGLDTAGEVVEIGKGVTRFKVGDRVVGHANGTDEKYATPANSAFQSYTVLLVNAASPIPSTLSYESAAVLPLGLSTAACGLFEKDQLGLQYPSISPKPTGKTLLVWGGATSVGCNAIQLGVAAGYEVFTTCSPKNFDYVKQLGASQAFDYNSKTVVNDLIHAFEGKTIAGAISIATNAFGPCLDILDKCKGDKVLSLASFPVPQPPPKNWPILTTAVSYMSGMASIWVKSKTRGIRTGTIFGSSLLYNEVGKAIYVDFLPRALAEGAYIAAPEPQVIGKGLEYIQAGYDLQRKGVSAKKIVVSL